MNLNCLVCNTQGSLAKNHIKNLFSDSNTLPSSRTLLETLQDILEKPSLENVVHSKILCRKCYKTCIDYDGFKSKMNILKVEMGEQYSKTVQKLPTIVKEEKSFGTVVVPASKLQPVPADFQLNFANLAAVTRSNINTKMPTPLINLKVTIGSSVFTQSLKTSTVKIGKPVETVDSTNIVTSINKDDMAEWNVNVVPKEIFSTNEYTTQNYEEDENVAAENGDGDDDHDDENEANVDQNEMEIDEECVLPVDDESTKDNEVILDVANIKTEASQSEDMQYIKVTLPADGARAQYVLGKLNLYNDGNRTGDRQQHTIVVDGENASLLEMMTGQKLIYENGELSLVMDKGEGDGDDDGNEDDDAQDSNDESQIELQVSGDEETANAIIAAAQEQGGAFIKVESGEMYRVKSVQSAGGGAAGGGAGGGAAGGACDVTRFVSRRGDRFSCALCSQPPHAEARAELLEAGAMMKHLKEAHDAKLYICRECGAGMRRRHDYTTHMASHSTGQPAQNASPPPCKLHACSVCRKRYNSRTLLHEHMNTHTGARPHACAKCGKTFASKYTHRAHLKTHQVRPRPYKCAQCNKTFLSQQNLTQHEKTHSGVKNFICNICNKAFGTQHNLEVHGVVHSGAKPHACTYCEKCFARRAELNDHLRIHTGERPFECEVCGVRFAQRSNLHSHRRATHLDDKRHKCPDCPKRFKRRRLLEYHIKASHTGERPLQCGVCRATFVYPEHYKKHARIHSGERPYFCEICGKSFNSRDNRNTHRFTHSDKKPYECLACGHSYMRKRLLIAHMNATGHLAESIVVNQPRVTRVHNPESGVTTIVQLNDQNEDITQQSDDENTEGILHTSGKLELLTDGKLTKTKNDGNLFIDDTDNMNTENSEDPLIDSVDASQLVTSELVTEGEAAGAVLRFIQVKLPDGNDGWVALND